MNRVPMCLLFKVILILNGLLLASVWIPPLYYLQIIFGIIFYSFLFVTLFLLYIIFKCRRSCAFYNDIKTYFFINCILWLTYIIGFFFRSVIIEAL